MARKALGRGLDALIPETKDDKKAKAPKKEGPEKGAGYIVCDVKDIARSNLQPRLDLDSAEQEDKLEELAASIKSQGVLQPLLVRPRSKGGYELIAGERRLRAAEMAGLKEVPVVVRDVDDRAALEAALIENIQRENLNPIEEALAYKRLMAEYSYTQEELSKRVGKDRATVANLLRLLNLPEDVREYLKSGELRPGHARAILSLTTEAAMIRLAEEVVKEGLSVREAERRVQGRKKEKKSAKKAAPKTDEISKALRDMEEKLVRELGTRVKIAASGKGGKIEIHFFSADELDRVYRKIIG